MGKGKHASDSGFDFDLSGIPFKQIFLGILAIAILFGIVFGGFNLVKKITSNKPEKENTEQVVEENGLIKTLEGFDVLGKIKVEELNIDTYILDSIDDKALKVAAGKINGNKLNEEGNFSVIGHNYDNIFAKLLEIEKGKIITVIDPKLNETKYEVKDVYAVEPDDLKPLLDVEDKTVLTLITCETTASTRLVVVCEKVDESQVEETKVENTVE